MNKLPIILLCGNAGVGKDTVGQMIVDKLGFQKFAQADIIKEIAEETFGFTKDQLWGPSEFRNAIDFNFSQPSYIPLMSAVRTSFIERTGVTPAGNKLKHLNKLLDGFHAGLTTFIEKEHGLSARIVLQLLGTEVGRAYEPSIWIDGALKKAREALIADAEGIVISDGRFRNEIVGVRSAGGYAWKIEGSSTLTAASHASEIELASIPPSFFDAILYNDKVHGTKALSFSVHTMLDCMLKPMTFCTYP